MNIKYFDPYCKYKFKKGDIVICKINSGRSELIVGKSYKVIKSSYKDYNSDNIDVSDENIAIIGLFSNRFTTKKIERLEKLKHLKDISNL